MGIDVQCQVLNYVGFLFLFECGFSSREITAQGMCARACVAISVRAAAIVKFSFNYWYI